MLHAALYVSCIRNEKPGMGQSTQPGLETEAGGRGKNPSTRDGHSTGAGNGAPTRGKTACTSLISQFGRDRRRAQTRLQDHACYYQSRVTTWTNLPTNRAYRQ